MMRPEPSIKHLFKWQHVITKLDKTVSAHWTKKKSHTEKFFLEILSNQTETRLYL